MTLKRFLIISFIFLFFVVLMISFSFPDLFSMFYVPHLMREGNIYTLVNAKKQICPWLSAVWPPLYFQTMGLYLIIVKGLGLVKESLFQQNSCPIWTLIMDKSFLFWAKFPFLILHFLSGWVFSLFFKRKRFIWFLVWILNPIAIFINFIQGQFDSIPTFFLLVALYGARKRNSPLTAFMLGLGAAYKLYPFLLVIPFMIIMEQGFWKRIQFAVLTVIPYVISIIPVINQDFASNILSFSENTKMLEAGLTVGNMKISYYIVGYMFLILSLVREKKKDFNTLIKYSFLITILYFLTTMWFVQRALFLLPLLLLVSSKRKQIWQLLPFFYATFFAYALWIFPGLFVRSIPLFLDPIIQQVVFSIMTGFFVWFGYLCLKEDFDGFLGIK